MYYSREFLYEQEHGQQIKQNPASNSIQNQRGYLRMTRNHTIKVSELGTRWKHFFSQMEHNIMSTECSLNVHWNSDIVHFSVAFHVVFINTLLAVWLKDTIFV